MRGMDGGKFKRKLSEVNTRAVLFVLRYFPFLVLCLVYEKIIFYLEIAHDLEFKPLAP